MLAVKVMQNHKVVSAKVLRINQNDTAQNLYAKHFGDGSQISNCYVGLKSCDFNISKMIEISSTARILCVENPT